jgi:hypothetical protein
VSNGPGSKPAALHTEYVEEEVGGPAYGTQDLVFYLLRADADEGDSGIDDAADEAGFGEGGQQKWEGSIPDDAYNQPMGSLNSLGAEGATGFAPEMGNVQSGAQQVAMGKVGRSVGSSAQGGYSMGPMSGMNYEDEEPLGAISQNASLSVDVGTAVRNAIRSVPSLESQATNLGLASSERMFNGILRRNYSRDSLDGERGSVEDILESADRPPTAELAFLLARESGGLTRVRDLAARVNSGEVGLVTPKSRAFQERMGPNGSPRRR